MSGQSPAVDALRCMSDFEIELKSSGLCQVSVQTTRPAQLTDSFW